MTKILIFLFSCILSHVLLACYLSLRINRLSYFSLTLSKKYTLYTITDTIHCPLKKRRIRSRIDKQFLLFFIKNYIIMFHKETSHTHTRRILNHAVYQSYILTSSTTIAFQPIEIQRIDVNSSENSTFGTLNKRDFIKQHSTNGWVFSTSI